MKSEGENLCYYLIYQDIRMEIKIEKFLIIFLQFQYE